MSVEFILYIESDSTAPICRQLASFVSVLTFYFTFTKERLTKIFDSKNKGLPKKNSKSAAFIDYESVNIKSIFKDFPLRLTENSIHAVRGSNVFTYY